MKPDCWDAICYAAGTTRTGVEVTLSQSDCRELTAYVIQLTARGMADQPAPTLDTSLMTEAGRRIWEAAPLAGQPDPTETECLGCEMAKVMKSTVLHSRSCSRNPPQGATQQYPSYCKFTGYVFPCGCSACDVLSGKEAENSG